jgi:hypothetical protein
VRWFDVKYGGERVERGERVEHDWIKAHAICGVTTNVVTAVEIHDRDAADAPQFKPLVEKTAENFNLKEVPADKAYLSHDNLALALVEALGGAAFVPFKSNSQAGEVGSLWHKMFCYYHFFQTARVPEALPPAVQRREHVQHGQGEVPRPRPQSHGHGHEERGVVQVPLLATTSASPTSRTSSWASSRSSGTTSRPTTAAGQSSSRWRSDGSGVAVRHGSKRVVRKHQCLEENYLP